MHAWALSLAPAPDNGNTTNQEYSCTLGWWYCHNPSCHVMLGQSVGEVWWCRKYQPPASSPPHSITTWLTPSRHSRTPSLPPPHCLTADHTSSPPPPFTPPVLHSLSHSSSHSLPPSLPLLPHSLSHSPSLPHPPSPSHPRPTPKSHPFSLPVPPPARCAPSA